MSLARSISIAHVEVVNTRCHGENLGRVSMRPTLRKLLVTIGCAVLLNACATQPATYQSKAQDAPKFPLDACKSPDQRNCVATLFTDDAAIGRREPDAFPPHYLELADPAQRSVDCINKGETCENRLKIVADYFNPKNQRPEVGDLGVALEGGGSKAAPFALGTLAGLQELDLLSKQVRAISSISGGSYAASYYFNRLYDQQKEGAVDAGTADDWFRSCIPEYFIGSRKFDALREQAMHQNCWEKTNDPDQLRSHGIIKPYNEFAKDYEFLGHVWKNHDLLRGDTPGNLHTSNGLYLPEYGNLTLLSAETLVTIPFQFLARTVFRWPLNSAPSKLAYKLGLERQYGYTPHDWKVAGGTDVEHLYNTLSERRKTRTLKEFKVLENAGAPLWIIGTTAPSPITGAQWLLPSPRDPLRQQFELTWDGYGSGTYGYARQSPEAQFDFLGRNPDGLSVLDAVVASAAFLDDDQTQISRQPFRLAAGAGQHFLNLTWFTELRNFNVSDGDRRIAKLLPWPAYLSTTNGQRQSPYIHLQDGGNTENTGILPLLRRGYKTIVYAHGTQDGKAEWAAICHLKNQLELDGAYFIRSPDLEYIVARHSVAPTAAGGRAFASYLDALCSSQLDASDLAAFDENPMRSVDERIPAVAKLYCGRLGYNNIKPPCAEFTAKFGAPTATEEKKKRVIPKDQDLFYQWPAGTPIVFKVYRGDTLKYRDCDPEEKDLLSTIIAVVPGIAWSDVATQLLPRSNIKTPGSWDEWCSQGKTKRNEWQIGYCYGPDDKLLAAPGAHVAPTTGLPCIALAHVLEDCPTSKDGPRRPRFPQDDFVMQTLHTTYTSYAAYFDLARHQVRSALGAHWPSDAGPLPNKCSRQARL
ncbi:hypothetical protein QU481_09190 [Crenobacter sp. SG2303]|uniref:PNPLA domain-containing protein n=1 Tax=Crenobacter oryzisoli TaxID=3056844 RepID=A0ABT7XMQ7_9NEIS|nr:hypothetical protein [Crenobacter sp. SG2303]MDN0075067.1 hypothetical protein [Crenobacter sp. SG2303]